MIITDDAILLIALLAIVVAALRVTISALRESHRKDELITVLRRELSDVRESERVAKAQVEADRNRRLVDHFEEASRRVG